MGTTRTNRLRLRKRLDLLRPVKGLPLVIDEVWTMMGEVT